MRALPLFLSTLIIAVSLQSVNAQNVAKPKDPLADLDYFAGSWLWKGTWKRAGQQPEDFSWRFDMERTLDGRFLLEKQYDLTEGNRLVHLSLVGWCDEDKTIKGWGFWAPPSTPQEEVVYKKTNDGWKITREGLDGKVTVISQDTWKYEADFVKDGAENHWGFTATRLNSPTEADARRIVGRLAGNWSLVFDENGNKTNASIRAVPGESDLVLRLTYDEGGEKPATGIFAWHAGRKQIVETWFAGGGHIRICFDGVLDDGSLIGPGEGMLDDEEFSDLRTLKFDSPDSYTHKITGRISGGESRPDVTITSKRATADKID